MQCSTNHIYIKIRDGDIKIAKHLGSCVRIPMSQFKGEKYKKVKSSNDKEQKIRKKKIPETIDDIANLVWD